VTVDEGGRGQLLVRFEHAGCGDRGVPAIEDVNIDLRAGEWVAVVGPQGAGKTTLVGAVLGLVAPIYGSVSRHPTMRVASIPQSAAIVAMLPSTAESALARVAGRRPWRRPTPQQRSEIAGALERVGLATPVRRPIDWLAGTDRLRVLIACAMVRRPDLLVLDDPFDGSDPDWASEMLTLLAELHADGQTILLTTQDIGTAASAPKLVCFNRTVVADGPPAEVLHPYVLERTFGTATPCASRR
jgi:ABC-type Mn2+/Zn2+ transport system ATPase subunit